MAIALKTWEDVKCWADVLEPGIRSTIKAVLATRDKEKRCPYLGIITEHREPEFVYCDIDRRMYAEKCSGEELPKPTLTDPRYHASVDYCFLQLFCTSDFKKCVDYPKPKKEMLGKAD